MGSIGRFATRHPVWFALAASVTWTALLLVLMGLASGALRRPYGDGVSSAIARLATTAMVVALVWRLGWLRASGIGRLGGWPVWLLALGGLAYGVSAGLHSFYGRVALDPSILIRTPAARTTILAVFVGALGEEVLFRGLVLHSFLRAWARNRTGVVASVVLTALLFAALHATQVLSNDLSRSAALLLVLQTLVVSVWWGALVVVGRSIWPAVVLHFASNAVVAVQGLVTSVAGPGLLAYQRNLWLSIPLGLVGIGLLARVVHRPAPLDAAQGVGRPPREGDADSRA
jgi:membrane protease YdiL (CAAX protease family)